MPPLESPSLPSRGAPRTQNEPEFGNLVDGRVRLLEHDPKWPYLFEREARRVRDALGDRVLLLEHVGSTSVPGLCAKPCVDILLVVADSADEPAYVPDLESAGYSLAVREPEWYEHRVLKGSEVNLNLHVFSQGCAEVDRMLLFRDHLRADGEARERYATVKRDLAERTWERIQDYADAKSDIVEKILSEAEGHAAG